MSTAVDVEALTVAHGAVPAVRDISFTARRGELLTLLGPSGCGKTTTLRVDRRPGDAGRRHASPSTAASSFDARATATSSRRSGATSAWCSSPTRSGRT